ncbi:hypothetical protein EOD08_23960 [Mesorhizobium sp. M6A.T.Ca.TU.002.02.2.1]|nr:hypothetical protein EOD08_23960 [Mesorhizobium sp. M6A.T.Ca.TU.002.02.2.1]
MGVKMSLELSDGLFDLRRLIADYEHEARVLAPEDARILARCIKELGIKAREMENHLSRLLWNEQARAERAAEAERIASAVCQPGSNVMLFPVIPRPFSDGRPGGAA